MLRASRSIGEIGALLQGGGVVQGGGGGGGGAGASKAVGCAGTDWSQVRIMEGPQKFVKGPGELDALSGVSSLQRVNSSLRMSPSSGTS